MRKSQFSEEQIIGILKQAEAGMVVAALCRQHGMFLEFLDRLVRQQVGRKVFLIVDHHAVHKATMVAKWLTENENKIRQFFLPAYNPELNPDKLLNQNLKSNAFRQGRATDKQNMMSKTRAFLRSNQRRRGKPEYILRCRGFAYSLAA